MNTDTLMQLNIVPEGKEAWLTYPQYQELKQLFEHVSPFLPEMDADAFRLHHFLTQTAGLDVPMNVEVLHFNAFVLLRRGYKVEEITPQELKNLLRLIEGLEQPSLDDMDLFDVGGHRALYNYLTSEMGLSVEAGRGPVWYRAKRLIEGYKSRE